MVERGVESLFGRSKRVGWDCSLVRITVGQIDRHVAWRLKRLMISRKGRNLRAGQADRWTRQWLVGLGLHLLMGTIRYPGTA